MRAALTGLSLAKMDLADQRASPPITVDLAQTQVDDTSFHEHWLEDFSTGHHEVKLCRKLSASTESSAAHESPRSP